MFVASPRIRVTCVGCRAKRALPEADRSRWPAVDKSGAVTLKADTACRCGSDRVKITIKL